MDWLDQRKYQVLLGCLLFLFIVYPVCHDLVELEGVLDVLVAAVFVSAFLVLYKSHVFRVAGISLGVLAMVGLWSGFALPGLPRLPLFVALHGAAALFLVLCVGVVLRNIFEDPRVSADSIYAALCAYLLIGLAFAHLYGILDATSEGAFHIEQGARADDNSHAHFRFAYFSLCTLTTLGYGDITPARPTARGLAVVEAVLGQFFLAVLIAELVGKRASQGPGPAPPTPPAAPEGRGKSA